MILGIRVWVALMFLPAGIAHGPRTLKLGGGVGATSRPASRVAPWGPIHLTALT
jgi:hypothetical protein